MRELLLRQILRPINSLKGISYAVTHDQSFFQKAVIGGMFVGLFWYLLRPLTETEWLFLLLSWFLMLIAELTNTAFEEALDKLHPEISTKIGRSKDMASGAVFLAGIFMLIVVCIIANNHLNFI